MAQKLLESSVRELQKSITSLTDEVCSLKSKILEQNSIISQQVGVISTLGENISQLKSDMEGMSHQQYEALTKQRELINQLRTDLEGMSQVKNTNQTSENAQPAMQRPIRQARLNATAKIIADKAAAATKNSAAKTKLTVDEPQILTQSQKMPTKTMPTPTNVTYSQMTSRSDGTSTKTASDMARSNRSTEISSVDPNVAWTTVEKKRVNLKVRRVITGSGKADDDLQTVERIKHIQAWSFRPETSEESVLNYLNRMHKCTEYTVEKRDIKSNRHASFVIGFPESLYELISSPDTWPPLVKVSDWFLARRRGERGDTARACGGNASPTEAQPR